MNILGISYAFHDSAACLLKRGKLVSMVEEERFNRIKRGVVNSRMANLNFIPVFPHRSIEYVIRSGNILLDDVDVIAVGFSPDLAIKNTIKTAITNFGSLQKNHTLLGLLHFWSKLKRDINLCLKNIFKDKLPEIFFVPHHIAHAASSVYTSGLKKSSFIVWDRVGELISMKCGLFDGGIEELSSTSYFSRNKLNSIGMLYSVVTEYLGFNFGDEGKVMGLASYGQPSYNLDIIEVKGLTYKTKSDYKSHIKSICNSRKPSEKLNDGHRNLASTLQNKVNEIGREIAENLINRTKVPDLCLSGGVALNCTMNRFIADSEIIENIFIPPCPGDQGVALGAALHLQHKLSGKSPIFKLKHSYYGPEFSNEEIKEFLDNTKIRYQIHKNPEKECANLLSEGKIVGWFQGSMEFGPRALGNRSILADPRSIEVRDKVNNIKGRENWRPLAPSVLHEKGRDYFEDYFSSPFMNISFNVKRDKVRNIEGVTHVDGTSRLQSVEKEENNIFHKLIKNFYKKTEIPMILNTSFNRAGEPIVCTPEDAVRTFYSTELEHLFIGNCLISK